MTSTARAPGREPLPVADGPRTRAAVRALLAAHRGAAAAGSAVMIVATGIGLLTAPLLGRIVDLVVSGRPADAITVPAVLLVAVALAQGAASAWGLSLIAGLGERILATLRERFVEHALRLPLERIERAGSGDLTSRVTNDVAVVSDAVRTALPAFARSALTIMLTLGALAILDWRFLLAATLAGPVQAHTARWYVRRAVPLYAEQRVAMAALQQQLLDTVGGAATVRAFRLAGDHEGRVRRRSWSAVLLALRGVHLVTRFFARLNLAEFVGLTAVLATGFLLVRGGDVSVGTASAAALYFHSLFNPINAALALLDDAQTATSGLARIVGIADIPPSAVRPPGSEGPATGAPARAARPTPPAVRVRGLGFGYRTGHDVLHGVDLDIAPGERIALVGASGAGKTTLARLIAGIHRPGSGSILLGDVPAQVAAANRAVALISQEVHVFAGPLADDLRLARPGASDREVAAALTRVNALTWVNALPEGPATAVGDGGHRLTGAQAQQLALARLVLADPPIAVLDEATAEAGSAGARVLESAAAAALEGRTALVVAHRLAQAATADRVIVLDGGRVIETGPHRELLAAGGGYAALWAAWSDGRPAHGSSTGRTP